MPAAREIESKSMLNTAIAPEKLGTVLLDQKAAFPYVLYQYIFFVLDNMKLPHLILEALHMLHVDNKASITLYGVTGLFIQILKGIRQGCPL